MTPHLLHVGYPKAGSSWLQRWFAAHPQLAYAEGGIGGFRNVFDVAAQAATSDGRIRWRVTSTELLTAPRANAGRAPARGHAEWRPEGGEQARACTLLASLFPSATVLIVTRGFRSMILSSYSQLVRTGGRQSLEEMIAEAQAHRPWDYHDLIGRYRAGFGSDRVILLPYELLAQDPAAFAGEIERRLGLDSGPVLEERVNPALSPAELAWYPHLGRSVRRLPGVGRRAQDLVARAAFRNRLRPVVAALQRLRPRPPVTAALIDDSLVEGFRGFADCLAEEPVYAPFAGDYLFRPRRGTRCAKV